MTPRSTQRTMRQNVHTVGVDDDYPGQYDSREAN